MTIKIIGAGLAGCEAASLLSRCGAKVILFEQKPKKHSPAHSKDGFAELVCSNSLKADRLSSAGGLLKAEMRLFGSVCLEAAEICRVKAGGALAVDRDKFSQYITDKISNDPNIEIRHEEVTLIPTDAPVIVASGPLTDGKLYDEIGALCGGRLSFYDAAAPIVTADSIDMNSAFTQSRYEGGEGDYINCPMNKEEYEAFYEALVNAQSAMLHEFDKPTVYEGCMPIEIMAKRGADTIRFGPMKPVGLRDPRTGHRPWAVVQLRRENADGTMFNLVGFQTNLKFGEQKRVFSMIPALKNAEFTRYGVMHRNTFICSPKLLNSFFAMRSNENIAFAGQMTGVEGYMESAMSGIVAALGMFARLSGTPLDDIPMGTMMGALSAYISDPTVVDFQPMGANFGLLPKPEQRIKNKQERYTLIANGALSEMKKYREYVKGRIGI